MIVILEDDPDRVYSFRIWAPGAQIVAHAQQAIDLLKGEVGLLCLDHDLDGRQYVDSSEPNTGMAVVRWIVANKPAIKRILVHTHHLTAGNEMKEALAAAGYSVTCKPFYQLCFDVYTSGNPSLEDNL
jgi:hypothetical protein